MSYNSVILADSPVGFWLLNESSGTTAFDASGNANHGTYSGSFTLGAAALLADGESSVNFSGGSLAVPDAASNRLGAGNVSIELWLNCSNLSSAFASIFDTNGGRFYQCTIRGSQVYLAFGNPASNVNVGASPAFADNTLYHIVITSDHTTAKVYANGALVGSGTSASLFGASNDNAGFGLFTSYHGDSAPSGRAAKLALYNYVLTATQVSAHYAANLPSPPTATTNAASSITATSATLNGTVNPNGNDATVHFEYGTTTGYGTSTANQDAGAGSSNVAMSAGITGLVNGTTYHFRVVAVNAGGTTNGSDQTFVAQPPPAVAFVLPPPTQAQWSFILCDSTGNALAELSTASSRSISLKRNSYTEVQLTLSHEDDAASLLLSALMNTGVPKLKGYRRGVNDNPSVAAPLRFRGYLAGLQEQSDEHSTLTCTFRSPFGVLIGDGDKTGRFYQGATPLIYTATDAGLIAKALIDLANADATTGLGTGAKLVTATKLRDRTYPTGQNIGAAVMDLTAVLDGFDFYETFSDGPSVTLTTPALAGSFSTLNTWTGASNYFGYRITAFSGTGETLASNEVVLGSFINGVAGVAALSWALVPGAAGYNIYRAPATGGVGTGESVSPAFLASVGASATSYVDTGAAVSAGVVPSAGGAIGVDAFFNVVQSQGIVNPNARFEYGPKTIANVWSVDRTTTPPINCVIVTGGNGLVSTYSDTASVAKYGKWWGRADFSTIIEQATLDDKAKGLVRPNPVKTVKIVPDLALSPLPFDDWNLGDTVPFLASRSALTENTQLRINGFVLPISDDGQETIEVNDASSPEEDATIRASLIAEVVG